VVDLDSGRTIYERNANHFFIPASNAKLFTTALALRRLGPDHRFVTVIAAAEQPDADGVLHGDLRLIGGGDPTLSAREVPYKKGPIRGNPLAAIEALADELVARGLRRIEGDIIGDDSAYVWEPYPTGWVQEDTAWEYGAPVSALTLHDNAFRLTVLPGRKTGAPARLTLRPPLEYYLIHNRVKTVSRSETKVFVEWPAASRELHLWGSIRRGDGRAKLLAIRDPAHYAAWVLADALGKRGVAVRGQPRAKHLWMHEVSNPKRGEKAPPIGGVELARRSSPPLFEILRILNKVSQNLHAELVLREVGRFRRNIGSRAAGLAELQDFLREAGIAKQEYHFEDASGMSTQNLVTPAAVTELLSYMYLSVDRDGWLELLPVGGQDGTLSHRFRGAASAGRVLAKTGTLTHASALSGYAEPRRGDRLAFSILVNNYNTPNSAVRRFIDKVVLILLE
jgi:D-alanyl-D-alanine carboxypeptidase/D-alanyl-D-alanine-endopeptidase (penicillin-binding protein 4)